MRSMYLVGNRDRGRGTEAGSGWKWREYREGMVMKGGGRGAVLLSSKGGGACGIALWGQGREHLQCLPICCRFWDIPSTWWDTGGVLIYRNFGMPLSVPLRILPHCWSSWEVVGRSLDHARGFHDRAIRVMHGTRGGCFMMVAARVDTSQGKFLWWPWRVCSILD